MAITAIDAGDWCTCGLADNDPYHDGWHRIWEWNNGVMQDAKEKAMEEFDRRLGIKAKPKQKKQRQKNYVPLPKSDS